MGLVAVGGDHHDLGDAVVLPARQQLVDRAVQGLAAERGSPGVMSPPASDHPIGKRRCPQDPQRDGHPARHCFSEEGVGPERQVRSMLLERAHREEQARVPCQEPPCFWPGEGVQRV